MVPIIFVDPVDGGVMAGTRMKEYFRFALNSGRTVRMTDLHISSTHGVLNVANASYADHDIQKALTAMGKFWGPRATYLIRPACGTYVEHNGKPRLVALLPGLRYHAWLTSDPLDPKFCNSELVVIWFGFAPVRPLEEFVAHAVRNVPWEEHARDFNLPEPRRQQAQARLGGLGARRPANPGAPHHPGYL